MKYVLLSILLKLYHGTSGSRAAQIISGGFLEPRGNQKGNWGHTCPSRPDCVYLTDIYGGYFAFAAVQRRKDRAAVFEVETDLLVQEKLIPDEDFLEQATRGKDNVPGDIKKRTQFYREGSHRVPKLWTSSVEHLGTCAYLGRIPMSAVTRVSFIDLEHHMPIALMLSDPSITLANHRFCSERYRTLTRWIFGEQVKAKDALGWGNIDLKENLEYERHLERLQLSLDDRRGIVVQVLKQQELCLSQALP